ncbi:MAG: hypothetical protein JNM93_11765 [Bacteriovoracaceae bacterium]|nr:hypothetical protein [Bacteriovoracaceae bacterium]
MKFTILFVLAIFYSHAIAETKIITADGTSQKITLTGSNGSDGSNAHCLKDDRRENGRDGKNGQDAPDLIIQYSKIEDLKQIEVSSYPGRGGDGGRGCNGGRSGSDGFDGSKSRIYIIRGTYKASNAAEMVQLKPLDEKTITLSLNFWERREVEEKILSNKSNVGNIYYEFSHRLEKEAEFIVNDKINNFKVSAKLDAKSKDIVLESPDLIVFEKVSSADKDSILVRDVYTEKELFDVKATAQGKKQNFKLKLENPLIKQLSASYSIVPYQWKKVWILGKKVKVVSKLNEIEMTSRDSNEIELGHLNLRQYRSIFKKTYIGIKLKYQLNEQEIVKFIPLEIQIK